MISVSFAHDKYHLLFPVRIAQIVRTPLPLAGLRVVEFTHMVMGPTCGMVLADLGAEVIKVEPVEGDRTRHLLGAGAGFFHVQPQQEKHCAGPAQPRSAGGGPQAGRIDDVVAQNFKPGVMTKYGLVTAARCRRSTPASST